MLYHVVKVSGTPDLTRQRVRCERQLFDGRVKVHMTQIYERTAMANWCEVEVEFNMDKPENHFTDTASVTEHCPGVRPSGLSTYRHCHGRFGDLKVYRLGTELRLLPSQEGRCWVDS